MIVIEELDTEFGQIRITRSRYDGTYTYYQDECTHSEVNKDGISTCTYIHTMYGIIGQVDARRVLMIGCAGGTLATMLHCARCQVTAVDINPHAFILAKRYFRMPEGVRCIIEDGGSYIRRTSERYDAIAIDAFSSDGSIPQHLIKDNFFDTISEILKPGGVVVMNVMTAHDLDMRANQIALKMEAAKLPAVMFDKPGRLYRNTIIAGGNVAEVKIPWGIEPFWIRSKLHGIVRRPPRHQVAWQST